MTLEEFRHKTLGLDKPRVHRVRNSVGIYSGFKYYRKNRPKDHKYVLTESQYFSITRRVNDILANMLISGEDVQFPHMMGRLEIRKNDRKVKIGANGEVITNLPIDWDKTLRLWYEDDEARLAKTLVRVEEREIFKVYYNRGKANYNNKSYYEFSVNRDLKKRLKQRIKEGKIEAMYLDKNKRYAE